MGHVNVGWSSLGKIYLRVISQYKVLNIEYWDYIKREVFILDIGRDIGDMHKYRMFISDTIYNVILIIKNRFNVNIYHQPNKNNVISI